MDPHAGARAWRPAGAAAAVALVSTAIAWTFTCDDAAITFRFAEQAAAGHPLGTVAPGDPLVSGFSNPTWTVLLAATARIGLPVTGTAKVLGALCFVLMAVLATRLIQRLVPRPSLAWMGCAVGASSTVAIWSVSGLENPLVGLLVTATASLLVAEEQDGRTGWRGLGSSAVVAVLVVSRPDAFVYVAVAALARLLATRRTVGGWQLRPLAVDLGRWLAGPVVVLAAWTAFAVHRFGHPLANTVYAKVQLTLGERLAQFVDPGSPPSRQVFAFLLATAALLLVPLVVLGGWPRKTAATSVTILALGTLVLPLSEADWMSDYRFFSTSIPLLVVLAAGGLDVLARWNPAPTGSRLVTPLRFGVALVVLWAVVNVFGSVQRAGEDFDPQVTVAQVRGATQPIATAGDRWGLDDPLVMTADAGATVDDLDLRILDLAGLLDPQISHLMEDGDGRREYAFAERRPELVRAGYPDWSWNERWELSPSDLDDLGYLRLPGIEEPAYLRRDLVVRPASGANPDAVAVDQLLAPDATTGGPVTVRAWITAPSTERDGQIQLRLARTGAPEGAAAAETTDDLGSDLVDPDAWSEDEAVLHVAQLDPPRGEGDLVVTVESIADDGAVTTIGSQPVAWGSAAVTDATEDLVAAQPEAPAEIIEQIEQLEALATAAPAQFDAVDAAVDEVRVNGLDQLRTSLAAALGRGATPGSMESARRAIVPVRGRHDAIGPWSVLADEFQDEAASAEPEERYRLLVIAATADPADPTIQRDLLAARADRPSRLASTRSS